MNNNIKILTAIAVFLSVVACIAQTKNTKTESVKIYGNCEMCKNAIEKAGYSKKEATVNWDKNTKEATISYDSLKTSKKEILKRIALAGYDSDSFLAPDDTYSTLASCCQYERVEKKAVITEESKMEMASIEHSKHDAMAETKQEVNQLSKVFEGYFVIKDALVKTDGAITSTNAKSLLKAINEVQMDKLPMDVHMAWMKFLNALKKDTENISKTQDVEKQRESFKLLSKNIYEILKVSKTSEPVFYQYCPMQDANWLSKEETIKNPYYGSQMLSCGKTIETIK